MPPLLALAAALTVGGASARDGDGLRLVTFDHAGAAAESDGGQRSTGGRHGADGSIGVLLAIATATLLGLGAAAVAWHGERPRWTLGEGSRRDGTDASLREMEHLLLDREASLRGLEAALREAETARRRAEAEASRANRAKGDFLASVSHEIRTPLNAVLGFSDLLLAETDLTAANRRKAERIRGGGAALLSVVNDILDFAQADSGALRLEPRPFALPLLVDECLALVESAAVDGDLALHVELDDRLPAGVLGDDARLRQILLNLLNNAIKFTPRGSVSLRIDVDGTAGPHGVRFVVADTGIGIDAADVPNLFQRFRQVDGTIRRARGGTGLGLAICKALVELMGGAIGVTSTKDVGSAFWFAVDLPAAPLPLRDWSHAFGGDPRALRILLVEDIKINQELVRSVLEAKGHGVDVVCDGADAIMAASDTNYDLVLMDLQMPYVDGLSATRAIRAFPHPRRFVPIVALSANVRADRTAAAMAAGMDACLAKPLDFDALDALLDAVACDALRAPASAADACDAGTLARRTDAVGQAKVAATLEALAATLSARFTLDLTPATAAGLRAEAAASVDDARALGFLPFAERCRRFVAAHDRGSPDTAPLAEAYAALRCELRTLVAATGRLASTPASTRRAA